jgi:alkylhydroperoxidase family enzyme
LPFASSLLLRGLLPRTDTELLTLRTAWNCASWYEWVHHVPLATNAGLSSAEIAGAAEGLRHSDWTPRQLVLLEAADELHAARVITDSTWERLSEHLTPEECIETCFLVGHYEMLAMVLSSLGVEPEAGALRKLDSTAGGLAGRLADDMARLRTAGAQSG